MNENLELITAILKHHATTPTGHLTVFATLALLEMEEHVQWHFHQHLK